MGERGPVGKAPGRRHGHRTKAEDAHDTVTATLDGEALRWPAPAEDWHPYATDWFVALQNSGQAVDYTPSDVATARILAENLSRQLHQAGAMSGNSLAAFLSGCSDLLATAGSRRRARLELETGAADRQADAAGSAVASLAARRRRTS